MDHCKHFLGINGCFSGCGRYKILSFLAQTQMHNDVSTQARP
jgi:hypothetical protein